MATRTTRATDTMAPNRGANSIDVTLDADGGHIDPIGSAAALDHWDAVEPLLERVLAQIDSGASTESILNEIQAREMQLWCVNDWQAMCITRVGIKPKWKSLTVAYLAGDGMAEWFDDLMDVLESFAQDLGCKYVETHGRKGWAKVGKNRGYNEVSTMMRKRL